MLRYLRVFICEIICSLSGMIFACLRNVMTKRISKAETVVHIVGPNKLQNGLLTLFLETEAGLKCTCGPMPELMTKNGDKEAAQACLVMLDCMGIDRVKLRTKLGMESDSTISHCPIVLFNVEPDDEIEKEAVDRGVRGIFYDSEPLDRFPKGILAVLNGELWYSRKALSKCALEARSHVKLPAGPAAALTSREKEILTKIASGAGNKKIADDLCISTYTVKTHIYNIYKKINVPNRLHATLWMAEYL
jgi:DNA-binding NarL/FixJ family response regulator